jgi:hypothetical protein
MPFAETLQNLDPKTIQSIGQGVGQLVDIFRKPKRQPPPPPRRSEPAPRPPLNYQPSFQSGGGGKNKTLLYVGIGVGVLALGVITILLIRKK